MNSLFYFGKDRQELTQTAILSSTILKWVNVVFAGLLAVFVIFAVIGVGLLGAIVESSGGEGAFGILAMGSGVIGFVGLISIAILIAMFFWYNKVPEKLKDNIIPTFLLPLILAVLGGISLLRSFGYGFSIIGFFITGAQMYLNGMLAYSLKILSDKKPEIKQKSGDNKKEPLEV